MFRDTFAVEMLLGGVPLEQVSMLLGHKGIKITEKHYSPWVLPLKRVYVPDPEESIEE